MAQIGRPPKPTALKRLEGNPGKRNLNVREPTPSGPLVMPDGLSSAEADEWENIVGCFPDGFYTAADQAALTVHCRSWVLFNEAANTLRRDGQTLATKEGLKAHPAVATFMRASEALMRASDKLGLNPSARARMAVPLPKERKAKFDGLLGGKPLRVATTNGRAVSSRSSKG